MSVMRDDNPLDHVPVTAPHVHTWAGTHDRGIVCTACGQPKPDHGALRAELAQFLIQTFFWGLAHGRQHDAADALLAGPLAPVLAERDELRATIARVEALVDEHTGHGGWISAQALRRALDGDA